MPQIFIATGIGCVIMFVLFFVLPSINGGPSAAGRRE